MLAKLRDSTSKIVSTVFDRSTQLITVAFDEVFNLSEWAFRVGSRVLILYLLYSLVVEDWITKLIEAL